MNKSNYFSELSFAYDAEINDLVSDSEGKSVLKIRLAEKRKELKAILPMVEFSPEMVAPAFYDAFSFPEPKALLAAIQCEPDDDDFVSWSKLAQVILIENWAQPLIDIVLAESAGDAFLVTTAGLEFIRLTENSGISGKTDKPSEEARHDDEEDSDDDQDLAEQGDDWLAEQGFDSFKS